MSIPLINEAALLVIQPNAMLVDGTGVITGLGDQLPTHLHGTKGRPLLDVLRPLHASGKATEVWEVLDRPATRLTGRTHSLPDGGQLLVFDPAPPNSGPFPGPFVGLPGQGVRLLQSLHAGVLITDKSGRIEWANRRFEELFGFGDAEVIGRHAGEFLSAPGTDQAVVNKLERAMLAGQPFAEEIENATKAGATRWVEVRGEPVRNDDGQPTGHLILYEDIDLRKRAGLEQLREHTIYEAVLRGTGDGIYIHDLVTGDERWLGGLRKLYGLAEDDTLPPMGDWLNRIPSDKAAEAIRIVEAYRQGSLTSHILEFPLHCYDGTHRWMFDRGQVLDRDEEGRPRTVLGVVSNIDAWKKERSKAANEADLYRKALQGTGDGVWELDLRTMEAHWGPGLERLLGLPSGAPTPGTQDWLTRVPTTTADQLLQLGEAYRSGAINEHYLEYPIQGFDERVRWVVDRGRVLERDDHGQPVRLVGVVMDVTANHETQQELERSEQRMNALLANLHQALLFEDEDNIIRLVNPEFCASVGKTAGELMGKRTFDMLGNLDMPQALEPERFLEDVRQRLTEQRAVEGEVIPLQDGRILERDYTPVEHNGRLIGHLWVYRDITEHERLEQEVQRTKELLGAVVAALGTGIAVDVDGRLHLANKALCTIFGASGPPSDLIGMDCLKAATDFANLMCEPDAFLARIGELKHHRQLATGDLLNLKDGRIIERDFLPVELANGSRVNVFSYRDVSEHHQLLQALKLSTDQQSMVFESMGSGLLMEDAQGRLLLTNVALIEQFGMTEADRSAHNTSEHELHEVLAACMADPTNYLEDIRSDARRGIPGTPRTLYPKSGRVLECTYHPMPLASGHGHLWTYSDITERHRLEQEKQDAVKARERLLSALSHATGRLVMSADVMDELPAIFEQIGTATEVHRVYLFENTVNRAGDTISSSQRVEWNSGAADPQINNPELQDVPVELFVEFIEPMRSGKEFPRAVRDVRNEQFRTTLEAQGIVSILILPITVRGAFWGFIGFDDCVKERFWSENELAVLRSLSSAISAAVERSLLTRERDMELNAERTVNSLTKRMMGMQDKEDVYRAVVEEIGRFVPLDHCSFHTPRATGHGYHMEAVHSNHASPMAHRVPEGLTHLMDAMTTKAEMHHAWSNSDPLGTATGALFEAVMPVTIRHEILGVVGASCTNENGCADLLLRVLERAADAVAVKLIQLRAFQLIRQQDERYQRIINNMDLGLVEVDINHRITAVNQKFTRMSGFPMDALVGRKLLEFPGVRHALDIFEQKRDLRRRGQSDAYELDVHNANGEPRHWFISGAPSQDQHGQHAGSVNVILDITDRKRMEHELYEANIKARSSLQAKELFLANISHEMRTPMNVVLGLCDALIRHEDRSEQLDQLRTVHQATHNLLALTNDILSLSRSASGNLEIHPRPTSIHQLTAHWCKLFQPQAKAKGLAFSITVAPELEAMHACDAQRLDQVVVNLLGNAIKFTSAGRVDLEVKAEAAREGLQHVVFTVRDSGIGISPAFQERLFEPFSRDPHNQSADIEGSGLGLSICKHLMDLMHGGIHLDSTLGEGTEAAISLSLPVVSAASHPIGQEERPQEFVLPPSRILLVEDSAFNRKVVEAMLKDHPIELLEAAHGAEALEVLGEGTVDLVLLDLRMPVMDGTEFLRILRDQLMDPVPVMILTAGEVTTMNDGAKDAVITRTLQKPFERLDLLRNIEDMLQQGARPDVAMSGSSRRGPSWDRSTLAGLVGHEPGLMTEIMDAFKQDAPHTLAELAVAARSGNVTVVGALAHRMRPSLHMLGINATHDLIDELIEHGKQGTGQARCPGLVAVIQRIVSAAIHEMGN